jgi:putative oxidoreductase
MLNFILWLIAGLLALLFFTAGSVRALRYEFAKKQMAWVGAVPRPLLIFISCAEVLGALGLVLPGLTHTATWLTPLAGAGLVVVQVLAFGFHVSRRESPNAIGNTAIVALLAFVVVGRLALSPLG